MSPESLREQIRMQPFAPLRIFLTDGKTYDIRHPEMVLIDRRALYVGTETKLGSGVSARTHLVSWFHVVRIEPIESPLVPSNGQP